MNPASMSAIVLGLINFQALARDRIGLGRGRHSAGRRKPHGVERAKRARRLAQKHARRRNR